MRTRASIRAARAGASGTQYLLWSVEIAIATHRDTRGGGIECCLRAFIRAILALCAAKTGTRSETFAITLAKQQSREHAPPRALVYVEYCPELSIVELFRVQLSADIRCRILVPRELEKGKKEIWRR